MSLSRRKFINTIGGVGVVFAASTVGLTQCDQMPATAVEPWKGPSSLYKDDVRLWALSHALLAPNPHNMQPWLVDLRQSEEIVLWVDRDRVLPETDPYGRQVLIGHGTFLEILDLAARARGYSLTVDYFPEGTSAITAPAASLADKPVARIRFAEAPSIAPDPLFQSVFTRRSTKEPYDLERPLSQEHADQLSAAMKHQNAVLKFALSGADVERLRHITREGVVIETYTPAKLEESINVARIGAKEIEQHRDGIDLHGPMFWWLKTLGLMNKEVAMTEGTMAFQAGLDYAMGWADGSPSFGWMTTAGNQRVDQVKVGQDYVRLNLAATQAGVAMHPVSQVLQEYEEMAELNRQFHQAVGAAPDHTVQMLFRLGYADPVPPSPRRAVESLLL